MRLCILDSNTTSWFAFLFCFVFFFPEMVEDWTVNYKADLLTFVPYEWSFNIVLRDFEMVWLGNQHNWIECASNKPNNGVLLFLLKIVLVMMFVVENNTLFQKFNVLFSLF